MPAQSVGAVRVKLVRALEYFYAFLDDNLSIGIAIIVFGLVTVFVLRGPYPIEVVNGIVTPLGWASWFDAYVTFPILTVLCLLVFKNSRNIGTLISLVAITCVYVVLVSYYFLYGTAPFGLAALQIPAWEIFPASILVPILLIPLAGAIILSRGVLVDRLEIRSRARVNVFAFVASISVLLTLTQITIRLLSVGTPFGALPDWNGWTSDIGIGTDVGASDFIHGINPYTHSIPPWGGSAGLSYGPFAYLLASPFSLLPVAIGAHLGTSFFFALSVLGVWKTVRRLNPGMAQSAALFVLALPLASWVLVGAYELHVIATAVIVWSLYAYVSGRHRLASLLAGVGLFTMVVPGILIIPYLARPTKLREHLLDLTAFAAPVVGIAAVVLAISPSFASHAALSLLQAWVTGQNVNIYFSPSANDALKVGLTSILAVWLVYRSYRFPTTIDVLKSVAVFLLLLPFAGGYYFPFFSLWGVTVAVIALFAVATRQTISGESQESVQTRMAD